jgi:8-oxo-dGTP diphosphatase
MENQIPRLGSAVLVEKDGKFLLGKRNKKNAFGLWVIPGGKVRYGETIKEAAIREIKEETNLDIELVKYLGHEEIINLKGDYHTIVFFHLAKPKHDNLNAAEDISDAKFFTLEEIKQLETVKSVEIILKKAGFWK